MPESDRIRYASGRTLSYDDGYDTWEVMMQHARDTDIYRLKDWYVEDSGCHIEFIWNGTGKEITFVEEVDEEAGLVFISTGYKDSGYTLYYAMVPGSEDTYYDSANDTFNFTYYPYIGGYYSAASDTYKITERLQ